MAALGRPVIQKLSFANQDGRGRPSYEYEAEAVGLEPTSGVSPPPGFKTGSSSGRMTSVCRSFNRTPQARAMDESQVRDALAYGLRLNEFLTVPGVGIEPTPPGSEPSIATNRNCPGVAWAFRLKSEM